MQRNYYQILGIKRNATEKEIKQAYRKLALEWHPDKNNDPKAGGKMQLINEAYFVLSNEKERRIYNDIYDSHVPYESDTIVKPGNYTNYDDLFNLWKQRAAKDSPFNRTYKRGSGFDPINFTITADEIFYSSPSSKDPLILKVKFESDAFEDFGNGLITVKEYHHRLTQINEDYNKIMGIS